MTPFRGYVTIFSIDFVSILCMCVWKFGAIERLFRLCKFWYKSASVGRSKIDRFYSAEAIENLQQTLCHGRQNILIDQKQYNVNAFKHINEFYSTRWQKKHVTKQHKQKWFDETLIGILCAKNKTHTHNSNKSEYPLFFFLSSRSATGQRWKRTENTSFE